MSQLVFLKRVTSAPARFDKVNVPLCKQGVAGSIPATSTNFSAASRDLLNPLLPGGRLEGIREILCFVDDVAVAELHNTHRVY